VDDRKFKRIPKKEARNLLRIPTNSKVLISVGGLTRRKGFHRVIKVLPKVLSELDGQQLIYLIIGGPSIEGDYSIVIQNEIMSYGLQDCVWMVGPKRHDELNLWLCSSDLFCLATSNEGCPNVLLEAMACGVPTVATDVGGVREVISTNDVGLLVEFGDSDALGKAIVEGLEKDWDTQNIIHHSQRHSWENVAEAIYVELKRLLLDHRTNNVKVVQSR